MVLPNITMHTTQCAFFVGSKYQESLLHHQSYNKLNKLYRRILYPNKLRGA